MQLRLKNTTAVCCCGYRCLFCFSSCFTVVVVVVVVVVAAANAVYAFVAKRTKCRLQKIYAKILLKTNTT